MPANCCRSDVTIRAVGHKVHSSTSAQQHIRTRAFTSTTMERQSRPYSCHSRRISCNVEHVMSKRSKTNGGGNGAHIGGSALQSLLKIIPVVEPWRCSVGLRHTFSVCAFVNLLKFVPTYVFAIAGYDDAVCIREIRLTRRVCTAGRGLSDCRDDAAVERRRHTVDD